MKLPKNKLLLYSCMLCFSCNVQKTNIPPTYPENIGDITFDSRLDNANFELINKNHIYQYFNNSEGLTYRGEKRALIEEINQAYKTPKLSGETGLIRVRFIVNFKGETDRFRVLSMSNNCQPKIFNQSITSQLLTISKSLKGWLPKKIQNKRIDYYQYLIFKIVDGRLIEIKP